MRILFALLVACVGLQAVERPSQPNVLWITAEDMSPVLEEPTAATHHTPQPARLRLLLVGGVSLSLIWVEEWMKVLAYNTNQLCRFFR